jgi:uncharacterized protein
MKSIIIGSVSENAGKTSFIIGLAKAIDKKFCYLKPFGDKLIYRKKRLWDYDAALITNIFHLEQSSEDMTIGFEHSKLRYMYDETSIKTKLTEMARNLGKADELLFVEGGKDLTYGASIRLDTLSLARSLGGRLLIVVGGDDGSIVDDITFVKRNVNAADVNYSFIINKVNDLSEFKNNQLPDIKNLGVNVLGVIPAEPELTYLSLGYLAEKLQARILAGEGGLKNRVKNIFVGSMSGDSAVHDPTFNQQEKLAIVSGDRSDYIVGALESSTSGVILTNNVLPPQNLISKAQERNIPLLLVPYTTYETAKRIDESISMLTKEDSEHIELLKNLIEKNVDIKSLV